MATVTIVGLKEFEKAVRRNPKVVINEGKSFIVKGMAEISRLILQRPAWQVGDSAGRGKGVPKDSGNLKQLHTKKIEGLTGYIYPTAPYAKYVHGRKFGEINKGNKVESRPWLDRAAEDVGPKIDELGKELLDSINHDLAR